MFRPILAIIKFSSERVLMFIRFVRLCNDGEISSSVVLVITTIKRRGWRGGSVITENPPPHPRLVIVVITKTTDDEISPSLHNRKNLINTNTLSDENLMMARIDRNM